MAKNPSKPSTLPVPAVEWNKVRQEHGRPDQAVIQQHERIISELDNAPSEKGGHGR